MAPPTPNQMAQPAPPTPSPDSPPGPPPLVSLKVVILLLWVSTTVLLSITVIILSTTSAIVESRGNPVKFYFNDVYAYRYMFSTAVIGLLYAFIQLFFTISQFTTGIKNPFNYQLDFYGNKVISYLVATGSAAGFGVSKDLKDAFLALAIVDSTYPVNEFFSRGYASASLLLLAFICLDVLSVLSSFAITKQPI